jgi:hypothetical protein
MSDLLSAVRERLMNPYHDSKSGKFTTKGGGMGGAVPSLGAYRDAIYRARTGQLNKARAAASDRLAFPGGMDASELSKGHGDYNPPYADAEAPGVESRNSGYGFYGTVRNAERGGAPQATGGTERSKSADQKFAAARKMVQDQYGTSGADARDFLDSQAGRHIAEYVLESPAAKRSVVSTLKEKWVAKAVKSHVATSASYRTKATRGQHAVDAASENLNAMVSVEVVEEVCPSCAELMRKRGWTHLSALALIEALSESEVETEQHAGGIPAKLCSRFAGLQHPFTACMAWAQGKGLGEGFCAALVKKCTGHWPGQAKGKKAEGHMNPYHDKGTGKFTSKGGGAGSAAPASPSGPGEKVKIKAADGGTISYNDHPATARFAKALAAGIDSPEFTSKYQHYSSGGASVDTVLGHGRMQRQSLYEPKALSKDVFHVTTQVGGGGPKKTWIRRSTSDEMRFHE